MAFLSPPCFVPLQLRACPHKSVSQSNSCCQLPCPSHLWWPVPWTASMRALLLSSGLTGTKSSTASFCKKKSQACAVSAASVTEGPLGLLFLNSKPSSWLGFSFHCFQCNGTAFLRCQILQDGWALMKRGAALRHVPRSSAHLFERFSVTSLPQIGQLHCLCGQVTCFSLRAPTYHHAAGCLSLLYTDVLLIQAV